MLDALSCLADNIYYESANEPYDGQVAVAQVVLNRADGDADRVCTVVYQKAVNPLTHKKEAAFSWTLGLKWRAPGPVDHVKYAECVWIAIQMLDGTLHSDKIGSGVLYYHAVYVHPAWKHMHLVARIGQHEFYRE